MPYNDQFLKWAKIYHYVQFQMVYFFYKCRFFRLFFTTMTVTKITIYIIGRSEKRGKKHFFFLLAWVCKSCKMRWGSTCKI